MQVFLQDPAAPLAEMLVLGEQVVEHPERGLEVVVDDVLRPGLGLRQSGVLHQIEGQAHVGNALLEGLRINRSE